MSGRVDQIIIDQIMNQNNNSNVGADLNTLFNSLKDVTLKQVLFHEDCHDNNCGVCQMKNGIDGVAYKKGLIHGIRLRDKYPTANFNLT